MKLHLIKIAALILINLVNLFLLFILIIFLGHFVAAIGSSEHELIVRPIDVVLTVSIILSIAGGLYAWDKPKAGAICVIIASIGLVYCDLDDMHLGKWPLYILFLSGLVLLFYVIYMDKKAKKEKNKSLSE